MITITNASTATNQFKNQINDLIINTFGFSFEKWHSRNLWNDDYERYSIIENDLMLSNISVYKMRMLINGSEHEYLQIGSVATRAEHRGKGLSREIMEYILNKYSDKQIYLHGDNSALGFYQKLGFKPFAYKQPYIQCDLYKNGEMQKLEITSPKVDKYLKQRNQYSKILDCVNQYEINWFHLLYGLGDSIYEIPQLDIMLVAEQQDRILTIYDIIAKEPMSFSQIRTYLCFEGVNTVQFGFNPDWLGIDYLMRDYREEDSTPLMVGNFDIPREYIVPMLIMT